MHLIYGGFAVFNLTALPLLILGRSVGTEVLVFGGGLFAMVLVIVAAQIIAVALATQILPMRSLRMLKKVVIALLFFAVAAVGALGTQFVLSANSAEAINKASKKADRLPARCNASWPDIPDFCLTDVKPRLIRIVVAGAPS